MTPSARVQAAIDLLDEIIGAARDNGSAADHIAKRFFAGRRYAGSKDRRAVRELVWRAIRSFGERPVNGRAAMVALADQDAILAESFDGSGYGAAAIMPDEPRASGALLPAWLNGQFAEPIDEAEQRALMERAPLDVRVNTLLSDRAAVLAELPEAQPLALPDALRLPTDFVLDNHAAFNRGLIEVQDYGSQLIVAACDVKPGQTVLDLCAGAGGKTLALAAAMQGKGQLIATDTNRNRLDQLRPRVQRAGADFVEVLLLNPGKELAMMDALRGGCDLVLVDAPCSGTGTWRRSPETRWRLNEARLKRVIEEQAKLLRIAAEMVAPGGHLVYAVCSVLDAEGKAQVDMFLNDNKGWVAEPITALPTGRNYGAGVLLTPAHDECDGFFFARIRKL
ncbi:MAG: RsmB/NOP family class I SAM-dependent RNA methyltransferase [Sphingorhabdus sp.]